MSATVDPFMVVVFVQGNGQALHYARARPFVHIARGRQGSRIVRRSGLAALTDFPTGALADFSKRSGGFSVHGPTLRRVENRRTRLLP